MTVDDACFVAQLSARELDWRSNIENHSRFVTAESTITSIVSGPARRLAASLGLGFSSQDWLIDDEGQLYFLDANPNGQWMFVGGEAEQVGIAIVRALEERLNAPDAATDPRLPH